ncbi:CYTH domain-containing protein [Candidatus Gracilibacteria bacterium]|nr:CYTH domain-containing protein [Candidatus Gracilibacteria bacterium]NJS40978.1 CYTH domain-containing protein [Candidatus Gracilibacteria bacterium]
MTTEYEIKFLQYPDNVIQTIQELGGTQIFPKTLFKRVMFDTEEMKTKRAWLRLRDEGKKITCTYKQVVADGTIEGVKEIEVVVDNFDEQKELLEQVGLRSRNYQENYREEWELNGVKIDMDTWPIVGTYIEVEGNSEEEVRKVCSMLDLPYEDGIFDTTDVIYKQTTGVDMLTLDTLAFDNVFQNL